MKAIKKRIIIEGEKVHRVGYRPFLLAKARRLRIPNYDAENLVENGTQKVAVSLGGEEKQVQAFVEFVNENYPENAKVSRVREAEPSKDVIPIDEYASILAAEQQNTVIQTGLGMLGKQDVSIDMQKGMLDKQDQVLDKQDKTITEIKNVVDKVGVVGANVNNLKTETKESFQHLNMKYDIISQNMNRIFEELVKERHEFRKSMEKELKASDKRIEKLVNAILQSKSGN